ncbi:MAG: carboxypeptidase regulatory-like domain-containing protein [Muribaculaceae bacterium]
MYNFQGKFLFALIFALAIHAFGSKAQAAVTVPYKCSFSEAELATWSLQDLDGDGINWYYGNSAYGGNGAASGYSTENDVNNAMLSPAISLDAGTKYTLSFTAYTSYYERENLEVGIGRTTDIGSHTIIFSKEIKNYYGEKCEINLPELATGEYYLSFRHFLAQGKGMIIVIKDLILDSPAGGTLKGKVSLNGKTDCSGVKVFLKEKPTTFSIITEADGAYEFTKVPAGEYNVVADFHGYTSTTLQATIADGQTTTLDIAMAEMPKGSFSGSVYHSNGSPVIGAKVAISGYDDYCTLTDANGNFNVQNVTINDKAGAEYNISIQKNLLDDVNIVSSLSESEISKTISTPMKQSGIPPLKIAGDGKGNVTWFRPAHLREHRYDNGEEGGALGYDTGSENNVVGNVFNYPMTLHQFRFFSANVANPAAALTVYVIEVGSNGEPTGKVLYSTTMPNLVNMWSEVTLPEPIKCVYGCAIAIAGDAAVGIARDNNPEILPGKKSFFASYYSVPDSYRYFSDMNYNGAFLIRTVGENIEENPEENIEYEVTRYNTNDYDNPDTWVTFPVTAGYSLTDNDWANLSQGYYVYTVKAHYTIDDVTSEATYSENVEKDMRCDLTLLLTTNSGDPNDAEDALFEVFKPGYTPHTAVVKNGSATIPNLLKGDYSVRVSKKGFRTFEFTVGLQKSTQTIEADLKQTILPVANIDYIDDTKTLAWDFFADINENFDGDDFTDFEINAPGENGWNYYDGDMYLSYGFSGISFPGMGSKMAAIIFNGNNTYPAMPQETAHSGERALAFFDAAATQSSENSEGEPDKHQTDDWFISPMLDYHRDFKFSFWARSYMYVDDALEDIRVGYSTTGMNPEDFTFVSELIAVPVEYKHYEFDIPKEAKYVAINNYTFDGFFLLVDDVAMTTGIKHSGEGQSYGAFVGYRVTIDGNSTELPANVTTLSLSDLEEGDHTASIVKIYASGESAPLTLDFNNAAGIESITADPSAPVTYYNLQGIKVENPRSGFFIRKQGNSAIKVYIK